MKRSYLSFTVLVIGVSHDQRKLVVSSRKEDVKKYAKEKIIQGGVPVPGYSRLLLGTSIGKT